MDKDKIPGFSSEIPQALNVMPLSLVTSNNSLKCPFMTLMSLFPAACYHICACLASKGKLIHVQETIILEGI